MDRLILIILMILVLVCGKFTPASAGTCTIHSRLLGMFNEKVTYFYVESCGFNKTKDFFIINNENGTKTIIENYHIIDYQFDPEDLEIGK